MSVQISYVLKLMIIGLLLGCLARMPYGYYQFVRLSTFIMFLALAYQEYEKKKMLTMLLCVGFAILLNPVLKVHFTRAVWNAIDICIACCVAIWLIVCVIMDRKSKL